MAEEILEGEFIAREEWEVQQEVNRPTSEMTIEEMLNDYSW